MKLRLLTSLLLLAGLTAGSLQAADGPRSTQACLQPGKENRHAMLTERAKAGGFDIMFIGDSITEFWENGKNNESWKAKLEPMKAARFGISGDRTEHVLFRVQNGLFEGKSKPKLVVLMIGTNNTGQKAASDSPEDIQAGVQAIIKAIHKERSQAKILLLAIFPRDAKPDGKFRKNNDAANVLLKELADGKKVFFADINQAFLTKDGVLEKSVMPDLLHPNAHGYDLWVDAVIPEINKVMKKR